MNSDVKQQVFDVLEGGGLKIFFRYKDNMQGRRGEALIPDDIESRMLDFLQCNGGYTIESYDLGVGYINVGTEGEEFIFGIRKDTPRPVAIAQAVCFVHNQLNAKEESK